MNLYGDYANLVSLKKLLLFNGEDVQIERLSIGDDIRPADYDFIYMGSGTEKNLKVVLGDMKRYADELKDYIDSGKAALFTGNSFEALGGSIVDCRGEVFEGLGFFSFTVTEQNKKRIVGDVILECDFLSTPAVGFINKCSEIKGINDPMFRVKMGPGNADGDKGEGVRINNTFCTHLTGPAMVKNPHLLGYIGGLLMGRAVDDGCLVYEKKGYEVTLGELTKRIEG
jgi:hypothetical protein